MTNRIPHFLAAVLAGVFIFAAPGVSMAAQGDCGQPVSMGANPSAADALAILKAAVGQDVPQCAAKPCICDPTGNQAIQASDALLTLKKAVGQLVELNCPCVVDGLSCTSAEFFSVTGSDLDSGWTGVAHNSDIVEGASIKLRTLRRCSDNQAVCTKNSDCGNSDCKPTCDCINDTLCEVTGPTHQKHCLTTLAECNDNADCPSGVSCVHLFGPPLPLSSGGNPVCVVSVFNGEITGTANSATGEGVTAVNLRSRVFLGIAIDQPCPRCGRLNQDPEIGDTFTCDGGQFPGATCRVQGVSDKFGGVSTDCPPSLGNNISGNGLAIRFNEVTTGTSTRTAQLPCANFLFNSHPSRGNGTCLDNKAACTSNADCLRCSEDPTTVCANDNQCAGKGSCVEAPDQPVTCGFWCHCGFCNNDPSLPCFENQDCPSGLTCQVGGGATNTQNSPQRQPNECTSDSNICGMADEEKCANTIQGTCSLEPFRSCTDSATCAANKPGSTCEFDFRPCFESRITRTGVPSPLGKYCREERIACNTNADCTEVTGDTCEDDASVPETVALFCVPATSSSTINSAGGLAGPGAITLKGFIKVCRCGDGEIGCDEECDDGNTDNGDGCNDQCLIE